jgi:hypothetical protein
MYTCQLERQMKVLLHYPAYDLVICCMSGTKD